MALQSHRRRSMTVENGWNFSPQKFAFLNILWHYHIVPLEYESITGTATPEGMADAVLLYAAGEAETIGECCTVAGAEARVLSMCGKAGQEAARLLQSQIGVIHRVSAGFSNVQIEDFDADDPSEVGTLGMALVHASVSEIYVSPEAVTDPRLLVNVLKHEYAHVCSKILQAHHEESAVVGANNQNVSTWQLYEAIAVQAEEETSIEHPVEYVDAVRAVEGLQRAVGSLVVETVMETGDLGALQQELWKRQLEAGTITFAEILEQAEITGFIAQARQLIGRFMVQKLMEIPCLTDAGAEMFVTLDPATMSSSSLDETITAAS